MTTAEKHIVDAYSGLFDGLSSSSKIELLESLAKSLKRNRKTGEKEFFKSYGAFGSSKPAEEIVKEIKDSRKFRKKDIKL
jgi:predicted nucleotidyltransferase